MARARTSENSAAKGEIRGAAVAVPRINPLTLVEAAVAGDDLQGVARSTAVALDRPVAIALPAFGVWAQWPQDGVTPDQRAEIESLAAKVPAELNGDQPAAVSESVPVRLGEQIVGLVAAFNRGTPSQEASPTAGAELRPWLEAAAAAAAVTTLMQAVSGADSESARRAFVQMLQLHAPAEIDAVLAQARRLGYDFSAGAIGVCASLAPDSPPDLNGLSMQALLADVGDDRILGLIPLAGDDPEAVTAELLGTLAGAGAAAVASSPRRGPAGLPEALREAAVLLELMIDPGAMLSAQEETYRLLVGVLIRDPDELYQLRSSTVAELENYDASHDTELLSTLDTFLAHHGSTTDTAEAMSLHRHTVGYRLARVQEVSGLSPYESEGRERLSLGLKANRILLAEKRRGSRNGAPSAA